MVGECVHSSGNGAARISTGARICDSADARHFAAARPHLVSRLSDGGSHRSRGGALDSSAVQRSRFADPDDAGGRGVEPVRVDGQEQFASDALRGQRPAL